MHCQTNYTEMHILNGRAACVYIHLLQAQYCSVATGERRLLQPACLPHSPQHANHKPTDIRFMSNAEMYCTKSWSVTSDFASNKVLTGVEMIYWQSLTTDGRIFLIYI